MRQSSASPRMTGKRRVKPEKKIKASEQIQLTLDGLTLIVTAGNTRTMFYCLSADEFPAVN